MNLSSKTDIEQYSSEKKRMRIISGRKPIPTVRETKLLEALTLCICMRHLSYASHKYAHEASVGGLWAIIRCRKRK